MLAAVSKLAPRVDHTFLEETRLGTLLGGAYPLSMVGTFAAKTHVFAAVRVHRVLRFLVVREGGDDPLVGMQGEQDRGGGAAGDARHPVPNLFGAPVVVRRVLSVAVVVRAHAHQTPIGGIVFVVAGVRVIVIELSRLAGRCGRPIVVVVSILVFVLLVFNVATSARLESSEGTACSRGAAGSQGRGGRFREEGFGCDQQVALFDVPVEGRGCLFRRVHGRFPMIHFAVVVVIEFSDKRMGERDRCVGIGCAWRGTGWRQSLQSLESKSPGRKRCRGSHVTAPPSVGEATGMRVSWWCRWGWGGRYRLLLLLDAEVPGGGVDVLIKGVARVEITAAHIGIVVVGEIGRKLHSDVVIDIDVFLHRIVHQNGGFSVLAPVGRLLDDLGLDWILRVRGGFLHVLFFFFARVEVTVVRSGGVLVAGNNRPEGLPSGRRDLGGRSLDRRIGPHNGVIEVTVLADDAVHIVAFAAAHGQTR